MSLIFVWLHTVRKFFHTKIYCTKIFQITVCISPWRLDPLVITNLTPFSLSGPSFQVFQKSLLLKFYRTWLKHLFHTTCTSLMQETLLSGQGKECSQTRTVRAGRPVCGPAPNSLMMEIGSVEPPL